MVENGAWFNGHTAVLAIALLIAVPLTTVAYSGTAELDQRGSDQETGRFRVMMVGLVVVAVCVLVSRLVGFQPGYVYGLFGFFAVSTALARRRTPRVARSVLWGSVALLGLGVVSWLVWWPVDGAVRRPEPDLDLLVLDSAPAATFVLAVQGAVFGLIPVEFMDGKRLRDWRWKVWAGVWGAALLLFVHVLFDEFVQEFDLGEVVAVVAPFMLFGILSGRIMDLPAPHETARGTPGPHRRPGLSTGGTAPPYAAITQRMPCVTTWPPARTSVCSTTGR
ncbi:FGLLP motif-containing membrane protein [Pseudonocardia humida]|uniref:Uncharacterized protein n=1 Tax=Pseudonocardia humida TaxID=2800819 RepID=A0ABT1A2U5_9PSEU|nr:FGLLP motif-containing membrane protein [Pseudonocardia humida]MCO1657317.1 hypothetical protein [Pseudonocardia humida]